MPPGYPTRPLFRYWRRAVDMRLIDYTNRTLKDLPISPLVWWECWRKGWSASELAELLADQVIWRLETMDQAA